MLPLFNKLAFCVTTVCGVGCLKPASGTWGSLLGVLLSILLVNMPLFHFTLIGLCFCLGLIFIPFLIKNQKDKDPGYVVIDELVAQMLVYACIPTLCLTPVIYLFGFVFFRLFDILKPWPADYFDKKVHNAFGIMMDDIVAAFFSMLCIFLIILLSF